MPIDHDTARELVKSGKPYNACCGTEVGQPHLGECVHFVAVPPPERCPECNMIGFHRPACESRTQDAINPKHYEHPSGVETIEVNRCMTFDTGNAFKYVLRAGSKDDIQQDLTKARWYLADAIDNEDPIWINAAYKSRTSELLRKIAEYEPIPEKAAIFEMLYYLDLEGAAEVLDTWREQLAAA